MALEAGNSPQMIFQYYRELVKEKPSKAWFAITPASIKAAREKVLADGHHPEGRMRNGE